MKVFNKMPFGMYKLPQKGKNSSEFLAKNMHTKVSLGKLDSLYFLTKALYPITTQLYF